MWRSLPGQAWQQLSRSMTGQLLLPEDDQFETLRRPATNRYETAPPQAIARCANPTDVGQVVNFSRRYGLEIAVRGAGHSFADHSSTTGLLIETGLMCTVARAIEGDNLAILTGPGSRKARNIERDPRVAISLIEVDQPYASVLIRVQVVELVDGDRAWEIIDRISQKYTGQPYPLRTDRSVLLIKPDH
ncbi:MAG TPA: FAD-binding protein, partial [Propionibacteriaceae bacterium]|nr:FAD-binding protein [Propionibacteriaceae bacterium]